jgi:predicted TIM-barrel fold metal-dependent hydrolase
VRRREFLAAVPALAATALASRSLAAAGAKVDHTPPAFAVPPGACDCHVHVFGPHDRFPLSADRTYTPDVAPIGDLVRHLSALRMDRVVIVQPSPYGSDNRCTLDGAQRLGDRARVVAVLADEVSSSELESLHKQGVRGVRVNLETGGIRDPEVARRLLMKEAERAAPLGWHVQTYTNLAMIAAARETIERLPVPLVVDHFGRAQAGAGLEQPGFKVLVELLRSGKIYVKLSATYRISTAPDYADAEAIANALVAANEDRVVWGSDWPHPFGPPGSRKPDVVEEFHREDDGLALARMARWVREPRQLQKLLVDNPKRF